MVPVAEIVLVVTALLAVAMLVATLTRNLPIPYTVFLVVVGLVLGALSNDVALLGTLEGFTLTPDLVFFIFLPALIFESALNLDARQLLKDIAPVFVLAAPALIFSTAFIACGLWLYLDVSFSLALLFGALIAATDPVAVVALFKELGAPARLTTLVEGESLLNDATAIVLFHILLGIAVAGEFASGSLGHAAVEFLRVFFGGILVGAVIGGGLAELMRRTRAGEMAILVMSLVMAYASFVVAEHILHVSGVMAAVSAAVVLGLYAISRIPQDARHSLHDTWEVIALVCNSLLFLMIGLSVDLGQLLARIDAICVAAALVAAARAASVYTLVPATVRVFSLPYVNPGERHIMWWGGLKGGLAIAIALSIPDSLPGKPLLVDLTLGVVLFTLLINAPTIRPLMARLGLDHMTEEERAELHRGLLEARQQARSVVARLEDAALISPANHERIDADLDTAFSAHESPMKDTRHLRHTLLEALRLEAEELESLYGIGLVDEYTYLDLRAVIRREKEANNSRDTETRGGVPRRLADGPLMRLERLVLKWLRERHTFTRLLARMQRARLAQIIQRDIATVLCAEAVLERLPLRVGLAPDDIESVASGYRERLRVTRERLAELAQDFPAYFSDLEQHLAHTAALTSARHHAARAHQHGDIGAKAFARIDRRLEEVMADIVQAENESAMVSAATLIATVPLFAGLSEPVLDELATRAHAITFLAGDIVIGQNEKGNALYILMQGRVRVTRGAGDGEAQVAELARGEFFGEGALLNDEVRSATVTAATSLTLLRLTRRDVLELAQKHASIAERLDHAHRRRS